MKIQIKNKKLLKAISVAGLSLVIGTSLVGCVYEPVTNDATEMYDVIDSNGENVQIEPQVLDVPGEDFKLIVEYSLDDNTSEQWRITDNKKITTTVYTQGLPEDVKVYIDNVHTDVSIVASKPEMDGITQDTMDDRIHNSLMYGFPIDNDTSLICVNEIEGQNDSFISGSSLGFNGYSSGTIEERRHSEEEYLAKGVYGNKISSSYGLLIQKGNNEPYGVDVSSDVIVLASNTITKEDSNGNVKVYTYDRDGNYTTSNQQKVKTKN